MKKKAALIFAVLGCMLFLTACSKDKLYKDMESAVSELRTNYFCASNEYMSVSIITGKREEPFVIDGKNQRLVEFAVITVTPAEDIETEYTYSVTAKGEQYTGKLDPHPFGKKYIADACKEILTDTVALTVTNANGREESFMLTALNNAEMITYKEALREFIKSAEGRIKTFYDDKHFNAEVYIRFLSDPQNDSGNFYWYIAVTNGETTFAALIDVMSGEIVVEI